MPIATPDVYAEMIDRAKAENFAYPAINVTSSQTLNAAIKGFADAGSDGIVQVSTGGAEYLSGQGVKDMVRISDARMSGTAYGTIVLHVSPEAAVGGALALVQNGDMIELDVDSRRLHLDVSEAELEKRRQAWTPAKTQFNRGYAQLYVQHVQQAHQGCDFDFLVGGSGADVPRANH